MKKVLTFLLVGILVFSGLGVVAINLDIVEYKTSTCSLNDELDQSQTEYETGIPIGNYQIQGKPRYNWTVAQSYIPGKEIQTRIQLLLSRNSSPPTIYPLIVCIREYLTGENIGMLSIEPEKIPEFPDLLWIEFDFDDMLMIIGHCYFIVCLTANETDNGYIWAGKGNNSYLDGQVYFSIDDGVTWDSGPPWDTADMCFKTYGIKSYPPLPPTINGPTKGKPNVKYDYLFTLAVDPNGDDCLLFVDWGDGINTGWGGPYSSGQIVKINHSWSKKATYTIKAMTKNNYGQSSNWSSLDVTIPRNKIVTNTFLQRFFQNRPYIFQFLQTLLNRIEQ